MPDSIMLHSTDVESRICQLLDMDDEELAAEMKSCFLLSDDRDRRICDTLGVMMQEVDRLISCLDEMDGGQPDAEEIDPISR